MLKGHINPSKGAKVQKKAVTYSWMRKIWEQCRKYIIIYSAKNSEMAESGL